MSADILTFPKRRASSKVDDLWKNYVAVVARFQSDLAAINIDTMRECVAAYDAWVAEFTRQT